METSEQLWAELPQDAPIITDMQRDAIKNFVPAFWPTKTQSKASQTDSRRKINSCNIAFDPFVMHTIDLRHYFEQMEGAIEDIQKSLKKRKNAKKQNSFLATLPLPPKVPDFPRNCVSKYNCTLSQETNRSIKLLLLKSIAVILKHAGYDDAPEHLLFLLAEILEDYLTKFLRILRRHYDDEASGGKKIMCSLEKTFIEMGFDGIKELHEFYVMNVINVHDNLLQKCTDIYAKYPIPQIYNNADNQDYEKEISDGVLDHPAFSSTVKK